MTRPPPDSGDEQDDNQSMFGTPQASIADTSQRPADHHPQQQNQTAPPYMENPYLAEHHLDNEPTSPTARTNTRASMGGSSAHTTSPSAGRRSAESTRQFPSVNRPESHAADRASLGGRSTSTNRRGLSSIREYFRKGSLSSKRSHASNSNDRSSTKDNEGEDGKDKDKENEEHTTPEQYEKKLEDPQHLLDTILEEPSEEHLVPVGEAAALTAAAGGSDGDGAASIHQRRKGYRENLSRTRRLRKYTRASRSIMFMRKWWNKMMSWALVTRVFVYWFPLALILFIPLAVGAWQNIEMRLGGTRVMWIFIWLEVAWASSWIGKSFAHYMPEIAGYVISVFVPNYFKYVDMILALELPVQSFIFTFVTFISFTPILWDNSDAVTGDVRPKWQKVVQDVCVAFLISAIVFFVEQVFIYIVSTSFHRERSSSRIEHQKKSINVLIILSDMAYSYFPYGSDEFNEEDESLKFATLKRAQKKATSKSKVMRKVNNVVGNATKGVSNLMESSGMTSGLNADKKPSVARIVKTALTNKDTREILACRIWKSSVMEDEHSLTYDDLISTFGVARKEEVLYMFDILDSDGQNGIDLDEMIDSVNRIGKESKQISRSLIDMNGAIRKSHYLLMCIELILVVVIFVGMLSPSTGATSATLGSTLLSSSWLFSTTAQEVFQACIFLFVKHPYDVGDWIETTVPTMGIVRLRCSQSNLMYSVFNQIGLNTRIQVSHAVLNSQFISNITRSPPSQVNITLTIGVPETTPEQLDEFAERLNDFVESNPRDFAPGPFLQITDQTDLDKMSLNVCINVRNNQDDIVLFSIRRTRAFQFIGRCIYEIPITVPRRDELAQNDPAVPIFQYNIKDIDEAMQYAEKAKGRRQQVGMREPREPVARDQFGALDDVDPPSTPRQNDEQGQVKNTQPQRRNSHSSKYTIGSRLSRQFSTTSRATVNVGSRSRRQVQKPTGDATAQDVDIHPQKE